MILRKTVVFVVLAVSAAFAACDSSSGGDTDAVVTDTPTDTAQGSFLGQLVDFKSKTGRKGIDLVVLNNDTGLPLEGFEPFKSGEDGLFELPLPPKMLVGFQATGQEDTSSGIPMKFHKTYQFNIPSDAQGKRVYAVNEVTYMTAPATAGIVVDKTKGILAGTIYFTDPATGTEEFVGCGTVTAIPADGGDPAGVVRYFDPNNDLPGVPSKAPTTTTGKEGTSRYIIGNLPEGKWKILVQIGGVDFKAFIRAPTAAEPNPPEVVLYAYPDSIAISNIYVSDPANAAKNPTPDKAVKPECWVDVINPT